MFVIDDVVRELLAYVRERALSSKAEHSRDNRFILRGLRDFETALAEVQICLAREVDELIDRLDDPTEFYRELADFLGSGELYWLASPAHVCRGLHDAYDRLRARGHDDQQEVWSHVISLRGGMLGEIQGALSDLRAVRLARDTPPTAVVADLRNRIQRVDLAVVEIRRLLDGYREWGDRYLAPVHARPAIPPGGAQ